MTVFFFFNDTATTEIYTLSLHDALPIWRGLWPSPAPGPEAFGSGSSPGHDLDGHLDHAAGGFRRPVVSAVQMRRSEEHTSELQSQSNLVCRLLLEKKKKCLYYCECI